MAKSIEPALLALQRDSDAVVPDCMRTLIGNISHKGATVLTTESDVLEIEHVTSLLYTNIIFHIFVKNPL
jgi:hypothetical protein